MSLIARVRSRVAAMVGRQTFEDEMSTEMRAHIENYVDDLVGAGRSREEAMRRARLEFGTLDAIKDDCRQARGLRLLDEFTQDTRYAWRSFMRAPGVAAVIVITLGLGIGANTAIFSVVHSVILQPLPYQDADGLVRISEVSAAVDGAAGVPQLQAGLNALELEAVRSQAQTLIHVGIYRDAAVTLTRGNETTRLQGTRLSPAVLTNLGVQPLFGRTFDAREENDNLVVLSHTTWQRYFGSDREILGRSLTLNGTAHSIVGVMPPGFQFPDPATQLWMPTALPSGRLALLQRMVPLARLKPRVPIETASREVATIVRRVRQDTAQDGPRRSGEFQVIRLQDELVAPVRPALLVLTVAVGFVLLIACLNVANLLLARGAVRRQEIALRHALGARRGRLIRQLLTESAVLGLAGGAIGMALAMVSIRLLRTLGATLPRQDLVAPPSLPRLGDITVDVPVLMFTLAVSLMTAIVFGLAPAIRQSLRHRLDTSRGSSKRPKTQSVLVVAELGMAMMLLIGGGLLIHSFIKLSNQNPGYDPANVLTFTVVTPPGRYAGPQLASFAEDVVARLETAPGVHAAGYTELLPMVRFRTSGRITTASQGSSQPAPAILGGPPDPSQPDTFTVSQHFMDAMGIRVTAGRGFNEHDGVGRPGVVLINRSLARSGFLGTNPLGQHVSTLKQTWEVVGIVDDVQQFGLDQDPVPQMFFEMRQTPAPGFTARVNYFVARTEGEPSALVPTVRDIVRQLDPATTVDLVAPMGQLVSNSISRPRLYAVLSGIFAAVATALAAVGMYGVMAYGVAQRTREIGIRMALGAQRPDVMHLVVRQGLGLTGVGLAIGLVAAMGTTRYLESFLFGLTPLDPTTFVGVSLIFSLIAILASYIPARRATNVDPLVALRYE